MAVQQNKKSPSKRGMHRAHDFLTNPPPGGGTDHRRSASAPPYKPQWLLSWQENRQVQSRVSAPGAARTGSAPVRPAASRIDYRPDCRKQLNGYHGSHRLHGRRSRPRRDRCCRAQFSEIPSAEQLILVGLQETIEAELRARHATLGPNLRLHNASQTVGMDEAPALALRGKKDSSMRVAVNLVKSGEAHACVSAGNTGALMAISRFVLKTLPGIDRPAIAGIMPTMKGEVYVLDLGANVNCTPEHLLQFAIMGAMLVSAMQHNDRPSIGLLNIGEEEIKGNEMVKQTAELLRASGLNFYGNVEGDDIFKGTTDVVVCDGFVGNVMLKSAEGAAKMLRTFLIDEFKRNWFTYLMRHGGDAGTFRVQAPDGSGALQRRQPARLERHSRQEPWLGRCLRLREGDRARIRRSARGCAAAHLSAPGSGAKRGGSGVIYSRIIGSGSYLPRNLVTNDDLARRMDTSRRVDPLAHRDPPAAHRGSGTRVRAASHWRRARPRSPSAGIAAQDIDLIIVATSTPDYIFPSTACLLQAKLGIKGCPAFDLQAVCSGFRLRSGHGRPVHPLRPASLRPGGRRGSVLAHPRLERPRHLRAVRRRCRRGDPARPTTNPASWRAPCTLTEATPTYCRYLAMVCGGAVTGDPFLRMDGPAVFKFAVRVLDEVARETLAKCGQQIEDVDWLIPHQANLRILDSTAKRLGLPPEKLIVTVDTARQHFGRLGAAGPGSGDTRRPHQSPATRLCCRVWAAASPGALSWCRCNLRGHFRITEMAPDLGSMGMRAERSPRRGYPLILK